MLNVFGLIDTLLIVGIIVKRWRSETKHPWTNGQGERMNRTLNEATVNR